MNNENKTPAQNESEEVLNIVFNSSADKTEAQILDLYKDRSQEFKDMLEGCCVARDVHKMTKEDVVKTIQSFKYPDLLK